MAHYFAMDLEGEFQNIIEFIKVYIFSRIAIKRYEFGKREYRHLFDGHACVHKFRIDKQKVFYSNKILQTESFKYATKNQTYKYSINK